MKYLITEDQFNAIVQTMEALGVEKPLANVKPTEPLSDEVIEQMWSDAWESVAEGWVPPVFARAVEARILGERK